MNKVRKKIINSINIVAAYIPTTWPLYAFVTSNPLAGLEKMPFEEAVAQAKKLFGATGYPSATFFRQAWEKKEIKHKILTDLLAQNDLTLSPEASLKEIEAAERLEKPAKNPQHVLDRLLVKWLSVFLDQGLSDWDMPERGKGFYTAWRSIACYDGEIPESKKISQLPEDKFETLESLLANYPEEEWESIFEYQLAALPGWTGFIKHRMTSSSEWQQLYPVSLPDYLAVRFALAKQLKLSLLPPYEAQSNAPDYLLQNIWLKAWEQSFQQQLFHKIEGSVELLQENSAAATKPDAQMVFCIDTRSEVIRRHVERSGNYETFGYAGFFGIAMDYKDYESGLSRKSCPPILESAYQVCDKPKENGDHQAQRFHHHQSLITSSKSFIQKLKKNAAASFGFVEGAGAFYGLSLLSRTLSPKAFHRLGEKLSARVPALENFCEPDIKPVCKADEADHGLSIHMSLEEKVSIARGAFVLMGWRAFSPLVAFIGHGSHTTNNPFGSSLDCGACAASPGRHNARVLAMLCNLPEVRAALKTEHGINIPSGTFFLGGEHNTTTDDIILFEDSVPETHRKQLKKLKKDLAKAKSGATAERLGMKEQEGLKCIQKAEEKAMDWAETRPEWGLASNAAFIISSRRLSQNINLQGRSFLHSYDWKLDPEGSALEGIMKGPMVVTQWINNHYYFSTVDNDTFGSGSKITQNVTGKFGVVQGNGGDLKAGLPLQSLKKGDDEMYHQPLRLTVLIHAPLSRVKRILAENEQSLKQLVENEWIYLTVMDPEKDHKLFQYRQGGRWQAESLQKEKLEGVSSSLAQQAFEMEKVFLNEKSY